MRTLTKYLAAATLAGAFAIGAAGTGIAAPQASPAGIKAADTTSDISAQRRNNRRVVRGYRRGYGGPGPAVAGAALGIIGAGIAAATAPRYYYEEPYPYYGYYGGPAYGYGPNW